MMTNSDKRNHMLAGGKILHQILDKLVQQVKPGQCGTALDKLANELIIQSGGTPAFKGFGGYPATICVSPNDSIVHGIPNNIPFKVGDIISLDIGIKYLGYCTDTATSVIVSPEGSTRINDIYKKPVNNLNPKEKLLYVTAVSLEKAIKIIKPGVLIGDLGHAIQTYAESEGFSVIRDLVGHGIGQSVHELPNIPNFGKPNTGPIISKGDTLAIEPMISNGSYHIQTMENGWEIKTIDSSLAAHFEHTIFVTEDGCEVLT
jgi:methionyl aminopeptidase